MTWLLVCLSQRDLWTVRLIFLSFLVFIAPLYGKRTSAAILAQPCNKKLCVDEEWSGSAYARSLQLVRSSALPRGNIVGEPSDLVIQLPFVMQEFMALLLIVYSSDVLRSVLSNDRVQALDIWIEFARDYHVLAINSAAEQQFFDEYL